VSAKPNVALSRWADQVGAAVIAPSSGLRDFGFQPGTPASPHFVNYELNQLYQWALYLSDGAFEGPVSFDDDVTVEDLFVNGDATVQGALDLKDDVTVATGKHIRLQGTGRLKHGTRELPVHIAAFQADGATTYVTFNQIGYITGFSAACSVQAWLPLEVGKQILSYQQFYDVQGTGSGILPRLRRMNLATGAINDVAAGVSDNTGTGIESQTISASHVVLSGEAYFIQVNVATANHRVHGAIIAYDDPP
jgi:hypothetical protein